MMVSLIWFLWLVLYVLMSSLVWCLMGVCVYSVSVVLLFVFLVGIGVLDLLLLVEGV